MRYWFDTEFIERPCTIDLISIGIIAEDGREFYAESNETDWSQASQWVLDNVKPHLIGSNMTRSEIGLAVREFVGDDPGPEFWAYYADYDWVVFCWLFGTMMDLPARFPMFCRDLRQWAVELGDPQLPKQPTSEHHALNDARWTKTAWEYLRSRALAAAA
jgi:hypothetical protein